ncbi:hypothetical protein EUU23_10360 [Sphingorhabdus sp. IMCC26285]|uniref:Uncharacterized protein n=1 Tax=Sphingorhabdus profundilacus TaxID=2509718 RepID=A0A6I4M1H5_9SPHN|nr:hypothetical protein [Sphingorhabdus profundilacus]MVZ98094.1 hypothetical protein [Sphingorhabdus profundilacus]
MGKTLTCGALPLFRTFILGIAILTTTPCGAQTASSSHVKTEKMDLPARFNASLPMTIAEMDSWAEGSVKFPPQSHVVDILSFGQPAMFRRLEIASLSVPNGQRSAWSDRWYDLLEFQTSAQEFCSLARPVIQGPESAMRMAVAGSFVRDCFKPEDRALVLRKDTPNRAVLDYFDSYQGPASKGIAVPYDDRLASAAADIILNGKDHESRSAAFTIIEQKSARAEAALLSIYKGLQDTKRKDDVALAFLRSNNPEGKRIAQEVCLRKSTDPMCSNSDPLAGMEPGKDPPKPSIAAIQTSKDRLAGMGFSRVASLDVEAIETDSVEIMLLEAGYGYGFDVETGMFPNGHDSLLRNLARLTSPALDAAVFEEIAPSDDVGPYELRAYLNGKRYSIKANNLGDWYDVDAALKLLDSVLADQKPEFGLLPLPTEDQTLIVIGGPKAAIDLAVKAKLIRRGDVGRAEQLGKDFENEVLEILRTK